MARASTEYGRLKKVLVCRPEFLNIETPINVIAEKHQHTLDVEQACKEHDEFVAAFRAHGVDVLLAETHPRFPYEVNTRDLGVATQKGIVFGRFYSPMRWGEHRLAERTLLNHRIPIFHKMTHGNFEGGDFMYIDDKTAAVGTGIRTDSLGLQALGLALSDLDLELISVDFDEAYLHLDMICNVIGEKVAIVCLEALPDAFVQVLRDKKFELISVSREDVFLHACNLLNIGDDTVLSHRQAQKVNEQLKSLGFHVVELHLNEILKSGGGPRCMSFPVERL